MSTQFSFREFWFSSHLAYFWVMLSCYSAYWAQHVMQFIELHSSCRRNRRCWALDEHEPALLIQELFGGSWICLKDMKQGCERENWLSCERCNKSHSRATCSLNPSFLNLDWSRGNPSFSWLPVKSFSLEKVGSSVPLRGTKGKDLCGERKKKVTQLYCLSSSLLQNKDDKTQLLQHVVTINGLNRSDPAWIEGCLLPSVLDMATLLAGGKDPVIHS